MTAPKNPSDTIAFQVRIPKQLSESIDAHRGKVSRSNYVRAAIAARVLEDVHKAGQAVADSIPGATYIPFPQRPDDDDFPISLGDDDEFARRTLEMMAKPVTEYAGPVQEIVTPYEMTEFDGTRDWVNPEHPAVTSKLGREFHEAEIEIGRIAASSSVEADLLARGFTGSATKRIPSSDFPPSNEETKSELSLVIGADPVCQHPENRRANYGAGPICTACGVRL